MRVWTLDRKNRKIKPEDMDTQKIKRQYMCIEVIKNFSCSLFVLENLDNFD